MYFLIDFENVHHTGLEGLEYLTDKDTVIIFYGATCEKIKKYRLQQILDSGCEWQIIRLARTGKNALDFYIATNVGEIFTADPNATIGIVSNDKGFRAVKDYWKVRIAPQNKLVQGNSVSICMSNGYDTTGRSKNVKAENDVLDMEQEHSRYAENRRIEAALKEVFSGSSYRKLVPQIMRIINNEPTPKAVYLATIKSFGKKEGLEVYRTLKLLPECKAV